MRSKASSSASSFRCGLMASTGHALTQAPQSTHVAGSMCSISASSNAGSSGVGWMQLTGQGMHAGAIADARLGDDVGHQAIRRAVRSGSPR